MTFLDSFFFFLFLGEAEGENFWRYRAPGAAVPARVTN